MSSYISTIYRLSTEPAVTCNLSYEVKREGDSVYYRFKVRVGNLYPNTLAFPYNLKADITLNNKKILSVRFCGLFLHREWRTRGFRKPVTVEHFQLN